MAISRRQVQTMKQVEPKIEEEVVQPEVVVENKEEVIETPPQSKAKKQRLKKIYLETCGDDYREIACQINEKFEPDAPECHCEIPSNQNTIKVTKKLVQYYRESGYEVSVCSIPEGYLLRIKRA